MFKHKHTFILLLLICFVNLSCKATIQNQVETVSVYSKKMDKDINNVVILPANYSKQEKPFPVVYLLHGYGANYRSWIDVIKKNIPDLATQYNIIIVCADGDKSWYWDSPLDPKSQYETYIASELVDFIDSKYNTIKSPSGRAISGFSMGGHGALWLTITHPDIFGACGSMSGGVDIRPFPKSWQIYKQLGAYQNHKALWDSHTVITQIQKLKDKNKRIIIDCGESDFFIEVNNKLHQKMLAEKIDHLYITSPGDHKPSYWRKSIDLHLEFFADFFKLL